MAGDQSRRSDFFPADFGGPADCPALPHNCTLARLIIKYPACQLLGKKLLMSADYSNTIRITKLYLDIWNIYYRIVLIVWRKRDSPYPTKNNWRKLYQRRTSWWRWFKASLFWSARQNLQNTLHLVNHLRFLWFFHRELTIHHLSKHQSW